MPRQAAGRALAAAVLLLALAVALGQGLRVTRGLLWPPDEDLFRDLAQARTMADGGWLADPFSRGERTWYNPLAPGLVALFSRLTGRETNEAMLVLGPWLGLLGPLAFAALAWSLAGPRAAAAATLLLLFVVPGRAPALLCATYSPWPFAAQVALGPFLLGLLAALSAARRPSPARFALAGALLGATFLAHTAPALLLGAVLAGLALLPPPVPGSAAPRGVVRLTRLGVALAVALAASSPFVWSIAIRYRLRVLNPAPGSWTWPGTGLADAGPALLGLAGRPVLVGLVLLGLAVALRPRPGALPGAALDAPARRLLLAWLGFDLALAAYAYGQPALAPLGAPPLVPAFHFWLHLGAPASVLGGLGLVAAADLAARRAAPPARARLAWGLTLVAALALAAAAFPGWLSRDDFGEARRKAEYYGSRADRLAAHRWVRTHTGPDDVFLAEHDAGLRVVATAGRKLVCLDEHFSNPFVPWEGRARHAAVMLRHLDAVGHDVFHRLAVTERVSYVLVEREAGRPFPEAPFLVRLFEQGDVAIYRAGCYPE